MNPEEALLAFFSMIYNNIYMIIVTVGVIIYSCAVDVGLIFPKPEKQLKQKKEDMEKMRLDYDPKILPYLLVIMSVFLLLMFKFPRIMVFIYRYILFFSSIYIQNYIIIDWIKYIFPNKNASLISTILSTINTLNWFLTQNALAKNGISICFCIFAIQSILRFHKLQHILIAGFAFLIFDVYWTFFSTKTFGKSVMEGAAVSTISYLPIGISTVNLQQRRMIGNGDIFFPGAFLNFFIRYDMTNPHSSSFKYGTIGYIVGLIVTLISCQISGRGQPALLYLNPFVLFFAITATWRQGNLKDIWEKGTKTYDENEFNVDEGQSIGADPEEGYHYDSESSNNTN